MYPNPNGECSSRDNCLKTANGTCTKLQQRFWASWLIEYPKHPCLLKSLQCMRSMYKTFVNIIETQLKCTVQAFTGIRDYVSHGFWSFIVYLWKYGKKNTRRVFGFIGYKDKSNFDISTWVLNWRFRAATLTAFSTGVNIILDIPIVFVVYMFTVFPEAHFWPLQFKSCEKL